MYLSKLCECIITKKQDLGKCRGISSMKERIEEARKRADKANRLNLLEKLVALPQIKPIFEQFCKMLHRSHNRDLVRKGGPPTATPPLKEGCRREPPLSFSRA